MSRVISGGDKIRGLFWSLNWQDADVFDEE